MSADNHNIFDSGTNVFGGFPMHAKRFTRISDFNRKASNKEWLLIHDHELLEGDRNSTDPKYCLHKTMCQPKHLTDALGYYKDKGDVEASLKSQASNTIMQTRWGFWTLCCHYRGTPLIKRERAISRSCDWSIMMISLPIAHTITTDPYINGVYAAQTPH